MDETSSEKQVARQTGRNEPCPCGSGKKYKRCCGVGAAPKLSAPTQPQFPAGAPGGGSFEQFKDQMDPQMMQQFSQMLGRLPKGQLQKLQNIMQRAMAGKDVTREAQDFEHSLPVELQTMLQGFQMPGMPGMPGPGPGPELEMNAGDDAEAPTLPASARPSAASEEGSASEMDEAEARRIVEAAAKEGKISSEEASQLLQPKGISKLWKKISGK